MHLLTPDHTILRFDLAAVIALAEHAVAAPEHRKSILNTYEGTPAEPSLVWVHYDGVYLMSSGLPALPGTTGETNKIVRPEGWQDPQTWHEVRSTAVGGDDFAEFLPLADQIWEQATLHEGLQIARASHMRYFTLTCTPSDDDEPGTLGYAFV